MAGLLGVVGGMLEMYASTVEASQANIDSFWTVLRVEALSAFLAVNDGARGRQVDLVGEFRQGRKRHPDDWLVSELVVLLGFLLTVPFPQKRLPLIFPPKHVERGGDFQLARLATAGMAPRVCFILSS